ncbi:LysR family transcriptional regulator [Caulobacter sp. S45]|uniref:LysR family transcriptional regulator n=1 Tax=Caulobacter sp. S45 TaxID=1641861 RepID=UPI00131E6198|nr:LysR family transcriptional regulator [Caulobacter sp. S45]
MIDNLRALAAVVDSKSVTKAASRLHLTQSAISRRIQQLEEALGGALLDRTQRPPSATALGRRVYEQSLPILRGVDELLTLTHQHAEPTGMLRFGISQAIGDAILVDAVEEFSGHFPALDLRVRAGWGAGLAALVASGEMDAAIIMLPSGDRPAAPLMGWTIATVDVVIVQSRRRPRVGEAVSLADLTGQNWILNPVGCGYRAGLERAMGERGGLRVAIDTYGTEIQLRMIASGLGLGMAPRSVLRASANRDEISVVDASGFAMQLDLWVVHLRDLGNLKRPIEMMATMVADGFARYAAP